MVVLNLYPSFNIPLLISLFLFLSQPSKSPTHPPTSSPSTSSTVNPSRAPTSPPTTLSPGQGICSHDGSPCSADAECQLTCARRELILETEANQFEIERMLRGGVQRMLQPTCTNGKSIPTCDASGGGAKDLECCPETPYCDGMSCSATDPVKGSVRACQLRSKYPKLSWRSVI